MAKPEIERPSRHANPRQLREKSAKDGLGALYGVISPGEQLVE
jgi:hypothetical protein